MKNIIHMLLIHFFMTQLVAQDHIFPLPKELQCTILSHVYTQYNHPIEFTHIALVAKYWHNLIKTPLFIENCQKEGFLDPALVFFDIKCPPEENNATDIGQNTRFWYKHPTNMRINQNRKGIFYDSENNAYSAVWVNPNHTFVYNQLYLNNIHKKDSFRASKMSLAHYIIQDNSTRELDENVWPFIALCDPITAKPTGLFSPVVECIEDKKYYEAIGFLNSSVSWKKCVIKWPPTYHFVEILDDHIMQG